MSLRRKAGITNPSVGILRKLHLLLSDVSGMVYTRTYSHCLSCFTCLLMAALPLAHLYLQNAGSRPISADVRKQMSNDVESRLTLGERIPLNQADIFSLELIEGISDNLAFKIIERSDSIHRLAEYLRPEKSHRAFEVVSGIGPKTAERLSRFLNPTLNSSAHDGTSQQTARIGPTD